MKKHITLAIMGLAACGPALASSGGAKWEVRTGAVICQNYFAIKDGAAAAAIGDARWLSQTGCRAGNGEAVRTVIDGNKNEPFGVLRARIASPGGDETIHIRARDIISRLPNGRWNTLPCDHGGGWRCEGTIK